MPGHAYIAGVPLTKWTGQPPDAFKKHQESTPEADSIQKLACVIRKVSNLTWDMLGNMVLPNAVTKSRVLERSGKRLMAKSAPPYLTEPIVEKTSHNLKKIVISIIINNDDNHDQ